MQIPNAQWLAATDIAIKQSAAILERVNQQTRDVQRQAERSRQLVLAAAAALQVADERLSILFGAGAGARQ